MTVADSVFEAWGVAAEDLPEGGIDEIAIAQQDRFEPGLQTGEEAQKSV